MTLPRIEAIALVGSKNQRLFLSSRAQSQDGPDSQQARDETLRLEYAAHCSLDIIEERLQPRGVNEAATTPSYLGLVLNLEDLAVYAMATSTKLKILLLLRPGEGKVKDLDCLTVLRAVHTCYLSFVSNPFQGVYSNISPKGVLSIGSPHVEIKSQLFERRIQAIGGWQRSTSKGTS